MALVVHTANSQRMAVWSTATMSWISMTQPIIEAGTVNIPATVTVGGTVAISTAPLTAVDEPRLIKQVAYTAGGDVEYVGNAQPNSATSAAAWRIKKFSYTAEGNPATALYADGNTNFDNVWDNRAALNYS